MLGALGTALLPDSTALTMPWLALTGFALVAVLAGIGAAVLPARRASRLDVLEAVATNKRHVGCRIPYRFSSASPIVARGLRREP